MATKTQQGAVAVEETEAPATRRALLGGIEYEQVEIKTARVDYTLIPQGMVVYVGAARNKSIPMVGRVMVETVEYDGGEEVISKTPTDSGIDSYDFSTHDTRGRLIKERRMPRIPGLPEVWDKTFCMCEHPEHLRRFMRMRNAAKELEFRVLIPTPYRAAFDHYVRVTEQRLGAKEAEIKETAA